MGWDGMGWERKRGNGDKVLSDMKWLMSLEEVGEQSLKRIIIEKDRLLNISLCILLRFTMSNKLPAIHI